MGHGESVNFNARIKARVARFDASMRPWAQRSRAHRYAYEFLLFGLKQAWACLFGGCMLALLLGSAWLWPAGASIARYDFLVVAAVALQVCLIALGLEKPREALVIAIFHIVGTVMELFKTAHGSWTYPEASILRIGGVPLFSGFMYACVGSYIARVMRLFDIRFMRYPPLWAPWLLAVAAYLNFFTHHYVADIRVLIYAGSLLVFGASWFTFRPDLVERRMPVIVGLGLVALFIWFAENLGTFAKAWVYPSQAAGWRMVSVSKLGAWYMLTLLSWVLVSLVHPPRAAAAHAPTSRPAPLDD
jgi:uncharacterized membrane protein YoaT (DUF817 family)